MVSELARPRAGDNWEWHLRLDASGRPRELSQTGASEVQRLYWTKLDDLAP